MNGSTTTDGSRHGPTTPTRSPRRPSGTAHQACTGRRFSSPWPWAPAPSGRSCTSCSSTRAPSSAPRRYRSPGRRSPRTIRGWDFAGFGGGATTILLSGGPTALSIQEAREAPPGSTIRPQGRRSAPPTPSSAAQAASGPGSSSRASRPPTGTATDHQAVHPMPRHSCHGVSPRGPRKGNGSAWPVPAEQYEPQMTSST